MDVPFLLAPVVAVAVTIAIVWVATVVVSTVVSILGVAIVSTVVSTIVSETISTVVSIPGVSFSLGVSSRSRLSVSRSLAVVAVVRVAIVASVMMSKTVVASIKKIRISLWIGNCLGFSFRLAHGEDGQAEKSQNPDHPADAEVG